MDEETIEKKIREITLQKKISYQQARKLVLTGQKTL